MPKLELLNLIFKQTISVYLGLNVFGNIFMLARRQYLDKFTFLVELCVCVQHEKKYPFMLLQCLVFVAQFSCNFCSAGFDIFPQNVWVWFCVATTIFWHPDKMTFKAYEYRYCCLTQKLVVEGIPQRRTTFYRTQVSLGSDLWVRFSLTDWLGELLQTKLMWLWLMNIQTQY